MAFGNCKKIDTDFVAFAAHGKKIVENLIPAKWQLALDLIFKRLLEIGLSRDRKIELLYDGKLLRNANIDRVPSGGQLRQQQHNSFF
jgi:hypothetical protein